MSDSSEGVAQGNARLVWDEKGEKREYLLEKTVEISIGRDKQVITLPDQKVSKLHAIVVWEKTDYVITDQKSSNGTYVNGTRIKQPTKLQDGDKISIGSTTFNFVGARLAKVENLATKIFSRPVEQAPVTETEVIETGKPADSIEHVETRIFEKATPEKVEERVVEKEEVEGKEEKVEALPQKEMGEGLKEISGVVEGLSSLIDQVNAARENIEKLRSEQEKLNARLVTSVSHLQSTAKKLETIIGQSVELNQKVQDSEFITLLAELSKKSTDVNLLVQLAEHAGLISDLAKLLSTHATKLDEIKQSLQDELADFTEG